jgi:hypothetical protein
MILGQAKFRAIMYDFVKRWSVHNKVQWTRAQCREFDSLMRPVEHEASNSPFVCALQACGEFMRDTQRE